MTTDLPKELNVRDGIYIPYFDPEDEYWGVPPEYHPLELVLFDEPAVHDDWLVDAATKVGVSDTWVKGFVDGLVRASHQPPEEGVAELDKPEPQSEGERRRGFAVAIEVIDRVYRPSWREGRA